jgi:hypothetical protein
VAGASRDQALLGRSRGDDVRHPRASTLPLQGEQQKTLSPAIPLGHFGAAAIWLVVGAAGLVVIAPQLTRGNIFDPRVIAVTHALTLGVITNAIFGALHQFLPAVVGLPIRYPRVARLGLVTFSLGVPLLVAGLWLWTVRIQAVAWAVLLAAVGLASWNVLPARRLAQRNRYVGGFVSLAHFALGLAMVIAAARIGHGLGWWEADRLRLLAAHFHLGVLGFASLTVVAFGSRMLPAFLGAPATPDKYVVAIGWVAGAGLALFTAGAVGLGPILFRAGGALMLLAATAHFASVAAHFRRRAADRLEPGLGFIALASSSYFAAILLGGVLLVRSGPDLRSWALYGVLAIAGWLVMFIVGVMHRVAPRLIVLLIAGQRRSLSPAAQRAELLHAPLAWSACGFSAIGIALLAVGIGWGAPAIAVTGAGGLLLGAVMVLLQAIRLGVLGARAATT